jgi:KaiC/GvpD/RAD55 family RecA-like ATPase
VLFQTSKCVWRVFSHNDDIIGKSKLAHDAFSLYALFHHGGDQKEAFATLPTTRAVVPILDFSWTQDFVISTEQAEQFEDPDWAYQNLVVKGHLHVYPAEPNGGKTTIFTYRIAPELTKAGFEVFYVNADISPGDAKQMVIFAEENGYSLLLPDIAGQSMSEVVEKLIAINKANVNCNNKVFIFDTLKKMMDVIQKSKAKAKELYKVLRQLTAKGITICLLAHTNKYKDAEGNPVYEGTGDLRADVDNLINLIPHKDEAAGSITVSTKPDKIRANFEPITFEIDRNRNVTQLERYVDTVAELTMNKKREQDDSCIQAICGAIDENNKTQKSIIDYCKKEHGLPVRTIRRVLEAYGMNNIGGDNKRLPRRSPV